jgi:DNA ligase-1
MMFARARVCSWFVVCTALFMGVLPVVRAQPQPQAPALLLANVLPAHVDVTQYLVSEKYDGVRAVWDGRALKFRSGRDINAPRWFVDALPKFPLDGELWIARRRFDEVSGIVRSTVPNDDDWKRVNYMIFELPDAIGSFEQRVAQMRATVPTTQFAQLKVAEQFRVKDRPELQKRLNAIVRAGGEGLMLHKADAPYVTGRSDVLFKLKPQLDTEAVVVAHVPGKGKHLGKMGALLVRTPQGVEFKLGTGFTDAQRANPPPLGTTITYTYRDLSPNGKPKFASFLRVRSDP